MNTGYLLSRSLGDRRSRALQSEETTRLLHALQPSTDVVFQNGHVTEGPAQSRRPVAHGSGVNAITIDKFEGRYLLSGGADSSIALWDLESNSTTDPVYKPLLSAARTSEQHKLGISQLCFYPFDSLAFLSSSYDHTVKIYSSETLQASASFDMDSVVYALALSPIASHLLVACATQHPSVRLIDLRSGASTHSLPGHSGAILSVAWSPVREHVLASGATDGSVRFWDVRRGSAELGVLDLERSLGIMPEFSGAREPSLRKAHRGPVNGIAWTDDGRHVVTTGHDERIRVWETETGSNTLANFGPFVRNSRLAPLVPLVLPPDLVSSEKDVLFYPNGREILMYEFFDGKLLRRLRRPEQPVSTESVKPGSGKRNASDRITDLAWRAHNVELYSAHSDGSITAWKPRTEEDATLDEEEEEEEKEKASDTKRKRGVLEDIYRDLTKRKITFGS